LGADLFSIGRSSLRTSKKALETTSHNIANSNTEGYSRQRITMETGTPLPSGKNVFGSGVNVQSVKREHDSLVEKKLNNSLTQNKFDEERTTHLGRVEEIFNEINSDGMNKIMNRFFNTFRELSNQPENEVVRSIVRDNANIVVGDFQRISQSITDVKVQIDAGLDQAVADVNSQADIIASLNKEIVRLENMGGESGDLRDLRDRAVTQIAEYFPITSYEDGQKQYVVNIEGAGSIVAGGVTNPLLAAKVGGDGVGSYKGEGKIDIYFASKTDSPITGKLRTGRVGALLQTRNDEVTNLRKQVDEMAHGLVHSTNAIHRRGFINKPIATDPQGNIINDPRNGKVTGINFFKEPLNMKQAAHFLDLSDAVKGDLNNISTGLSPNSPGDNRIAVAISKLQHEKLLGEGSRTFEESYLQSVGKIGLAVAKSKVNFEQSGGIHAQAKSIKERISGVSIDEETTNMVRYQHSYDASAKMIKAADEMFNSVLGMMR
jgi:flagellar hook-associated protein 1 FlgK